MNWKRGFRRITTVTAIAVAVVCAGLSVLMVLSIHNGAQSNLRWAREARLSELLRKRDAQRSIRSIPTEQLLQMQTSVHAKEKTTVKAQLEELEKNFWVNLSKGGLIGLYGVGGLVGGIIGFVVVWLLYKLFEWVVSGFCDNKNLTTESHGEN